MRFHQCCEVIRKYSEETSIDIVIAYDEVMSTFLLAVCSHVNILYWDILKKYDNSILTEGIFKKFDNSVKINI